jgi:hypothetical protein
MPTGCSFPSPSASVTNYAETAAEVDVARASPGSGGHGDRVLLMMRNRAEFVRLAGRGPARRRAGARQRRLPRTVLRASRQHGRGERADRRGRASMPSPHRPAISSTFDRRRRAPSSKNARWVETIPSLDPANDAPPAAAVASSDTARSISPRAPRAPRSWPSFRTRTCTCFRRNRELLDLRRVTYMTELPLFHINAQMSVYSSPRRGQRPRQQRFSARRARPRAGEQGEHTTLLGVMLAFILKQPARPGRHTAPARLVALPARPRRAFRDRFGLEEIATSPTVAPRPAWSRDERSTLRRSRSGASTLISTRLVSSTQRRRRRREGELLVRSCCPGR